MEINGADLGTNSRRFSLKLELFQHSGTTGECRSRRSCRGLASAATCRRKVFPIAKSFVHGTVLVTDEAIRQTHIRGIQTANRRAPRRDHQRRQHDRSQFRSMTAQCQIWRATDKRARRTIFDIGAKTTQLKQFSGPEKQVCLGNGVTRLSDAPRPPAIVNKA